MLQHVYYGVESQLSNRPLGIALSAVFFSRKIASGVCGHGVEPRWNTVHTALQDRIFFVSVDEFIEAFDFKEELEQLRLT